MQDVNARNVYGTKFSEPRVINCNRSQSPISYKTNGGTAKCSSVHSHFVLEERESTIDTVPSVILRNWACDTFSYRLDGITLTWYSSLQNRPLRKRQCNYEERTL